MIRSLISRPSIRVNSAGSSYGSVVFWRYAVCQRSAFSFTNAFHAEPHDGARPNVLMPAALIGRRSE